MTNPDWNQTANSAHSFGRKGRVVAPSDNDLSPIAKTIIMLEAGDLTIVPVGNENENPMEFKGLPAGYIVPYVVRRVTACTGVCATCD